MILQQNFRLLLKLPTKILKNHSRTLRQLSSRTETLEPVKLSYATYEDTTIDDQDKAPPLIVVHGLFGSKSNWNSLCKVFQQKTLPKRKVIAVDCRNHGDSPHNQSHTYAHLAADIKDLLRQLNVQKVALLGHSMGGRAVMLFALKYPELVEKLVVVDISPVTTSPSLDTMPSIFAALESVSMPVNMPASQARILVDQQLSKVITDNAIRAFLLTNLIQKGDNTFTWRINIPVLLSNFNNIARFPYTNDMTYEGPTLFLGGKRSDYINPKDLPEIKRIFPTAQLHMIENAGHWVHSEKPAEFLNLSLEFLND